MTQKYASKFIAKKKKWSTSAVPLCNLYYYCIDMEELINTELGHSDRTDTASGIPPENVRQGMTFASSWRDEGLVQAYEG